MLNTIKYALNIIKQQEISWLTRKHWDVFKQLFCAFKARQALFTSKRLAKGRAAVADMNSECVCWQV